MKKLDLIKVKSILDKTGYPVTYSHFEKEQKPPYIAYLTPGTNNLFADNKVYKKINNLQIELYTDKKDIRAEETIENLLNENEIIFEVTETYIESEKLFQRIYHARII